MEAPSGGLQNVPLTSEEAEEHCVTDWTSFEFLSARSPTYLP